MPDNRTPIERLIRLGWDALDSARRQPPTIDKLAQNAREALETARRGIFDESQLKQYHLTIPIDNAMSAAADLGLSVGEASIGALDTDSVWLLDANLTYLGALSFGVAGDAQRQVFLRQSTQLTVGWVNPTHWVSRPRWDVRLSPDVPLELRVQGGVGDADVNLSRLKLQSLAIEGNIGPMNITMPADGAAFEGAIRGAAGPLALNVPGGARGTINIRGGVGGLALNIAADAAVQLNLHGGVGRVEMQPGFDKIEAAAPVLPNTGLWETVGFHDASRRVVIHLADGMLGGIRVRVMRPV